ncbi:hypothetical protein D3C86_1076830 [compost metagenome]
MTGFFIGLLLGCFATLCICARANGNLRDNAMASATTSGYLVYDGKAYRVTLAEPKAGEAK